MLDPLLESVRAACSRAGVECAASGPESLAVAVSGGVDSVVLLHALVALGARPTVASADHGLRPEAAAELEFVRGLAGRLGLPFAGARLQVRPAGSVAAAAREARYRWLDGLPQSRVALGHHLDDQAETALDHLARGCGARGFAGMRAERGRYLRPMLDVRRTDIERYARENGLSWVEDPSNARGTRGGLRAEVLPALERLRPGATAAIARSARLLAEDDALLERLTDGLFEGEQLSPHRLRAAEEPLRRRALLRLARDAGAPDVGSAHLDAARALDAPGRVVALPGFYSFVADPDAVRCLPRAPEPTTLREGRWGLWWIEASEPLGVRAARPGERLRGRSVREGLRALGVPPSLRAHHPVFERADRRGIPGLGAEGAPGVAPVRVRCARGGPAAPGGGPFQFEL